MPGRLLVLTSDGQAVATWDVSLTTRTSGHAGMSGDGTDLHEVVQVSLRIDQPRRSPDE
ncbi:hypothetical protein [Nonomuraea fuscirosea]|uniref:hypothetical protein n=1 Tax=Nonomuraea fuscirosea TaxID=1291556 RepID=UPI00341AC543